MNSDYTYIPDTLYLAASVRELDRIAIQEYGTPSYELMSKAARFAFHCALRHNSKPKSFIVLCGAGNNAGDGYVLAHIAKRQGHNVICLAIAETSALRGDAKRAYDECVSSEVNILPYTPVNLLQAASERPDGAMLVDALLGTGIDRAVSGDYLNCIEQIKALRSAKYPVLAIDIPSGLSADTGTVFGAAVVADITTTFIGNKIGLYTGLGPAHSGQILFSDLDVPQEVFTHIATEALNPSIARQLEFIPRRKANEHKGANGRALLIGGNTGYAGAMLLATQACARLGAGLTSAITQAEHCTGIVLNQPEVMAHSEKSGDLEKLFNDADVIGIGPGLGQDVWAYQLLQKTLSKKVWTVLDADALNLIAKHEPLKKQLHQRVIITPHPGEAARLLGTSISELESDRLKTVKRLQSTYNCHVILKGSGSLVAHHEGPPRLCRYGNPGMASGGMGDVLTGMLCALLAQFCSDSSQQPVPVNSIIELAVNLHASAADNLSERYGERGLLASDLAHEARRILNRI